MKQLKRAIILIFILVLSIPIYQYYGSIDWAKKHRARIASLPLLKSSDDAGEFRIQIGKFEYLARVAGLQNSGPAVILLHGFPESSIMWTDLLEKASTEGYRVVAYDQRGYSPGARPKDVSNYHLDELTSDVIAVADKLNLDTFHLVGHDWGAVVAWNLGMTYADRLRSLTALSIPHIGVFFDGVQNHPEQQKRSSYFKRLQTPILPEYKFVSNELRFYKQMMSNNPKEYLDEYVALFSERGAATAAINWYRALQVEETVADKSLMKAIHSPTLFIWGKEDGVIAPDIIPYQKELITSTYREVSLNTGHGLIQSEPDTVISEIIAHFKMTE